MASAPDLSQPLIHEPAQTPAAPTTALGPLEHFVGTWTNQNIGNTGKGDPSSPFSYNVMPLPQDSNPDGFILKNFTYFEELTFSSIHGNAPNRGGNGTEVCNTLFYEQRVYFAEGPDRESLVHAENGSLLYLTAREQFEGPYGDTPVPNAQVPNVGPNNIIKQVSVPHGNSILAPGTFVHGNRFPNPGSVNTLPAGVNPHQYKTVSVGNPSLKYTSNPNQQLQDALDALGVSGGVLNKTIELTLSSKTGSGNVANINFEKEWANVTDYDCRYFLIAFNGDEFNTLMYTQTIMMDLQVKGQIVQFPHVTCNFLTRKT
jgi:hypothetical protein